MPIMDYRRWLVALALVVLAARSLAAGAESTRQAAPLSGRLPASRIVFRDTGVLDEKALRACLPDTFPAGCALDTLRAVTGRLCAGLGYYSPRIGRSLWRRDGAGGPAVLEVWLDSGPRTRLGAFEIRGVGRTETARLADLTGLTPGSAVSDSAVARALRAIVGYYADRGCPYAAARISSADLDSRGRLFLTVQVEPGQSVNLGEVALEGLKATRPGAAARIAGLARGEPYSESLIAGARARLLRSGLFREVSAPLVVPTDDPRRVSLRFSAEEEPSSRLEAALGSGGGAGSSRLAGYARLSLNNIFGTARAAHLAWQRPRRDWSSLALEYHEPWLAGREVSLDAAWSQQVRDSLYSSTGGTLRLDWPLRPELKVGLGAGFEKTSPGSETYSGAQRSTYWASTGSLRWNSVLRNANPTGGSQVELRGSLGKRRLDGAFRRELRAWFSGAAFLPLSHLPHLAALSGGLAQVSRGGSSVADLPSHARIPLGGPGPLEGAPVRGYAEEIYRGRRVAWANLEYRYLTGPESRLFLFYDIGSAVAPAAPVSGGPAEPGWRTRTLQGYGAGLQVDSRLGLLNLAVAFSPGAGLGRGRLHLSLAEIF
jgi:outer membrane protein assembly factor BamA